MVSRPPGTQHSDAHSMILAMCMAMPGGNPSMAGMLANMPVSQARPSTTTSTSNSRARLNASVPSCPTMWEAASTSAFGQRRHGVHRAHAPRRDRLLDLLARQVRGDDAEAECKAVLACDLAHDLERLIEVRSGAGRACRADDQGDVESLAPHAAPCAGRAWRRCGSAPSCRRRDRRDRCRWSPCRRRSCPVRAQVPPREPAWGCHSRAARRRRASATAGAGARNPQAVDRSLS